MGNDKEERCISIHLGVRDPEEPSKTRENLEQLVKDLIDIGWSGEINYDEDGSLYLKRCVNCSPSTDSTAVVEAVKDAGFKHKPVQVMQFTEEEEG